MLFQKSLWQYDPKYWVVPSCDGSRMLFQKSLCKSDPKYWVVPSFDGSQMLFQKSICKSDPNYRVIPSCLVHECFFKKVYDREHIITVGTSVFGFVNTRESFNKCNHELLVVEMTVNTCVKLIVL